MNQFPRWQQIDASLDTKDPIDLTRTPRKRSKPRTNVTTEDLESHECKWILNDSAPWIHCGAKRHGTNPYCAQHLRRAYSPAALERIRPVLPKETKDA